MLSIINHCPALRAPFWILVVHPRLQTVDNIIVLQRQILTLYTVLVFSHWLSDRCQVVRGGGEVRPITHGVIQGSLLGPILFLIFTNDLPSYLNTKVVMYADDVQFLHLASPKSFLELKSDVECTLDIASHWFIQNCLKINPARTDLLVVKSRRRRLDSDFDVQFGTAVIQPSAATKILGVVVDSGLTFESHVTAVIRRCYATLGELSKSARGLPKEVKQLIVEMLIFPHIRYCMSVWSGCGVVQRHRVQKVINHCAQVVMGVRRSAHVTPLLVELEWPQIDMLVAESDCGNVHYLLNNMHAPQCLSERLVNRSSVSSRHTRATENMQLELPRVRTEHARKFFGCRACSLWNSLPARFVGRS